MTIYLLGGDESFLIKQKLDELKAKLLTNEISSLNYLYYGESKLKDFIENTQFLSLGKRLIIFNNCNWFTKAKDKISDTSLKEVELILKDDIPDLDIIIVAYHKLDNSLKTTKLFKEHSQIFEFESTKYYRGSYNPKLSEFVKHEAKLAHVSIDEKAIKYLLDITNGNLWLIHQEINKLATFVLPNKHISYSLIESQSDFSTDIFALSESFLGHDKDVLLTNLKNILSSNQPLQIIAFFQTMLVKWIKIKTFEEYYNSKLPQRPGILKRELPIKDLANKIAGDMDARPFVIEKDLKGLSKVELDYLHQCQAHLIDLESQVKSGLIQDRQAVEMFFLNTVKK